MNPKAPAPSLLKTFGLRIALAMAASAILAWLLLRTPDAQNAHSTDTSLGQPNLAAVQVSGYVNDVAENPLPAATICAYGASTATQLDRYCVTTNVQGAYSLILTPGDYSVTASAMNHASMTSPLTLSESLPARLIFTLQPHAPTIAGIIQSAAGERIHAARVAVYQGTKWVSNVTTNDKGEFTAWTPPGSLLINVDAEGFGAAVVQTVAPTMDISVILYPGNVVTGQVLLKDSLQPVPNVHVTAVSRRDRVVEPLRDAAVRTDERGQFTFTNLSAGAWTLSVADRGFWGASSKPIVVSTGKTESDITLHVLPAGEVAGRFVVGDGETPCPAGSLHLTPEAMAREGEAKRGAISVDEPTTDNAGIPVFTALVKDDGTVRLEAVPYGTYRLGPICKEHQLLSGPPVTLEVAGSGKTELRWEFTPGLGVNVRVVDEAGRPIPDAAVALSPLSDTPLSEAQTILSQRSGATDEDGQYRFGGLRAGKYEIKARYAAVNGKAIASEKVDLQVGEPAPITLTLPGRGAVRIRAHTPDNAPLSRVLFFALDSEEARYEGAYQGDGRFVIGPLPHDNYRIYGYDNKNAKMPLNGGHPVSISRTEPVDFDFLYAAPNAQLEGRVIDSMGTPLPGVFVRAVSATLDDEDEHYSYIQANAHGGQQLMTNRSGAFRIEGLASQAAYDLHVDHPSGLKEIRRGISPGQFVEISFPKPATVVGSVIDATGKPVTRFDVLLVYAGTNDNRSQSFNVADGRFNMADVRPGPALIAIYGNEDRSTERSVTLIEGQTLSVGQFVLSADARPQVNNGEGF